MQTAAARNRLARAAPAATDIDPVLRVVVAYQDSLTRHWATQMWDRVAKVIGKEAIQCRSWQISELTDPRVSCEAAEAAVEADVLVFSVRDAGEWPMNLQEWIEAWLPRRTGRKGDLVAVIGVPSRPAANTGCALQYLENVARQAGLDFLPRVRKLPEAA